MANLSILEQRLAMLEGNATPNVSVDEVGVALLEEANVIITSKTEELQKLMAEDMQFIADRETEVSNAIKIDPQYEALRVPLNEYKEQSTSLFDTMADDMADKFKGLMDNVKETRHYFLDKFINSPTVDVVKNFIADGKTLLTDFKHSIDNGLEKVVSGLIDAREKLIDRTKEVSYNLDVRVVDPIIQKTKESIWDLQSKQKELRERLDNVMESTKEKAKAIINRNKNYTIEFNYDEMWNKPVTEDLESLKRNADLVLHHESSSQLNSRIEEDFLALKGARDYVRANYPQAYDKLEKDLAVLNFDKSVDVEINAYKNIETGVDSIGVLVTNGTGATLTTMYDIRSMEVTDIVYQKDAQVHESNPVFGTREVFNKDSGYVNYNLIGNGYCQTLINKYDKASETIKDVREGNGTKEITTEHTHESEMTFKE